MKTHAYAKKQNQGTKTVGMVYGGVKGSRSGEQQAMVRGILRKASSGKTIPVGHPGDIYEKEADRIARAAQNKDQSPESPSPVERIKTGLSFAPRPEDSEYQETHEEKEKRAEEEELPVQKKGPPLGGKIPAPLSAESQTALFNRVQNPTGGSNVSTQITSQAEKVIPYDFSGVKIHDGEMDRKDAEAIGARAFTYGNDIWLGSGESRNDALLLTHELVHVAQQGAAPMKGDAESSAPESVSPAPTEVQGNIIGDIIEDVAEWGADRFWDLVESVAPSAFVAFLREVVNKGIFGYLREKISEAAGSIFDALTDGSPFLASIFELFSSLLAGATEILSALAAGDCGPLFQALNTLKDTVSQMAGDAWNAITDFFAPVGEFFSGLWSSYGAPVMDWLRETAGDVWEALSGLGAQIWSWTEPVRDALGAAWNWVKEQLGFDDSGESDSEGGVMAWITETAGDVWEEVKEQLQPVIQPIENIIARVGEILPLDAILNLRETINGWLQGVSEMASSMDENEGGNVAERQVSLREQILPAVLASILSLKESLITAGQWIAEKVGAIVSVGAGFLESLGANPLVGFLRGGLQWLQDALNGLGEWVQNGVISLFTLVGQGLVYLSGFLEPILNLLTQIVETLTNILGKLPELILGPVWSMIPRCILDPIKNFFIEQILSRIPLFGQLVNIGEIWDRVRATAMEILARIFIDGDFLGALWLFFRSLLNLIGLPAQLVVQIIAKASAAFSDILMDPIGFLSNLLGAAKEGFSRFFGNILTHLLGGITGWLFGQLEEAGITPPTEFTFSAILGFVFDVLGLSLSRILDKMGRKLGIPQLSERIMRMIQFATGAWEWIQAVVEGGPAALWEKIQEKLSDLWNMVLDGVVGWVNSVIIATAARWLLSLLDVSGITPVINALIAVYRAIESFAAYLRQMLEIVNTVLDGIGGIARGAIGQAAGFLESALANAIPIAVGFLANQFGLGRVGHRIREMVGRVRERVDEALDWLIDRAIAAGRSFVDLLRSGREALANWWQRRQSFTAGDGSAHELYYRGQGAAAELIVSSNHPRVVITFLNGLQFDDSDPQKAQKEQKKQSARNLVTQIDSLESRIETQKRANGDTSALETELGTKLTALGNDLGFLIFGHDIPTGGRIPTPLTLQTLGQEPVPPPRDRAEEQQDINAAKAVLLLASAQTDGTEALARYFDPIKRRFRLGNIIFEKVSNKIMIALISANINEKVEIAEALRGEAVPRDNFSPQITYTPGLVSGQPVAVEMKAENLGPNHPAGSPPQSGALAGIMGMLVTEPSNANPSKYIRGHLLNHQIGGPGTNQNMYPITAEANHSHEVRVESTLKDWVNTQRYWTYYHVRAQTRTVSIADPTSKDSRNKVDSTFNCHAYIMKTDGGKLNEFRQSIISTYLPVRPAGHVDPNTGQPMPRADGTVDPSQVLGGGRYQAPISQPTGARTYSLDSRIVSAMSQITVSESEINDRIANYRRQNPGQSPGLGNVRVRLLCNAYRERNNPNFFAGLSSGEKASLTFFSNPNYISRIIAALGTPP